jgi:hypothetical protein
MMSSANRACTPSINNLSGSAFPLLNVPTKFNFPTSLNNAASLIRASHQRPATMPEGYIPSDFDVCSGRGKQNWNMTGTVNFRKLIHAAVDRYMAAELRNHKTAVIVSVVDEIRQKDGHFFKERKHGNSGRWYEIGDTAACKKVGHALRDQANDRTTRTGVLFLLSCRHGTSDEPPDENAVPRLTH